MCLKLKLFAIREKLPFTSSTAVFMDGIFRDGDERVAIMWAGRGLVCPFRINMLDTQRQSDNIIFFYLKNKTIYRTMWQDGSFYEHLATIRSDPYAHTSKSYGFNHNIFKNLTFFHRYNKK